MPAISHPARHPQRDMFAAALASVAIGASLLISTANAAKPAAPTPATRNVVVEWNRTLLSLVQTPGAQPATIQPTRDFALLSAAVYSAVTRAGRSDEHGGDQPSTPHAAAVVAAAAQAAHDVLIASFPRSAATLNEQLNRDLAALPPSGNRAAGVRIDSQAAAQELRIRATDGSAPAPPAYRGAGAPGDYRRTPPDFATPVFTNCGAVTPFVLRRGSQFRPAPPPALTSTAYAAAINEVERLGRNTSASRTTEHSTIAMFWAAPIQNYWNAIAEQVSLAHHDDVRTSARTFALLDLGIADATIAMYDAKYTYRLWRPITAIRHARADGNPRTTADRMWTPLATTPADPSYPGAHSTISATAATILGAHYGARASLAVTSPILPGVTRHFGSFHDVALEAGLSRIYAGVHTRLDHRAGLALGAKIGRYTLDHALRHAHG